MTDFSPASCKATSQIQVRSAEGTDQRTALRLLLSHLPVADRETEIDRLQQADREGELSLEGLLLATCQDRPVGAVLSVGQPDGCGFVWPPRVVPNDCVSAQMVADTLLAEVVRRLEAKGVWLGQCVLDPEAVADQLVLSRNGFPRLTNLHYLQRTLKDIAQKTPRDTSDKRDTADLQVDVVHPDADADRLADLIDRTYIDSRDCPALNGIRTGREAMITHRATGVFLPQGWLIFREADHDVGVLLFADQPEQNAWELVYLGVVPEARGRGYGRQMLQYGLRLAAQSSRRFVLLAVDEENHYARALYAAAGFVPLAGKVVHVRLFPNRTVQPKGRDAKKN